MGDSSYMQFTVKTKDLERVFELSPDAEDYSDRMDEDDGTTTLHFSEANYGGTDILQPLVGDNGVNFAGFYDAGGTYPDVAFANHDREYAEVVTTAEGDIVVIVAWKDGEVVPQKEDINSVKRYFQIRDKVLVYIKDSD